MKIVEKLLRAGEGRILKKLDNIAAQVNAIEEDFEKLTDAELRAETDVFRKRLADGETLDDILPEAFAAVREASKRTHRQAPLRRADHGRCGPAHGQRRRDAHR